MSLQNPDWMNQKYQEWIANLHGVRSSWPVFADYVAVELKAAGLLKQTGMRKRKEKTNGN